MSENFSRYEVYSTCGSVYCYTGTNVLQNRFGIHNYEQLKALEVELYSLRQNALLIAPINGRFSVTHLCSIHKYLFGDLYRFAGRYRRENIMKGTTMFLPWQQIPAKTATILKSLQEESYLENLDFDTFISRSSFYFAELNYIHPFREGNGRSTREFMRCLFLHCGYSVDWSAVEKDDLLNAMELSVYNSEALKPILIQCLKRLD